MLIPRFWSKAEGKAQQPGGQWTTFSLWRGSAKSQAEAEGLAQEAVGRVAARIERGEGFPERYAYAGRQVREELIREILGPHGSAVAALTRNSYGCVVLNAARAFFIDVDLPTIPERPQAPQRPSEPMSILGWLMEKLFGAAKPAETASIPDSSAATAAQAKRQDWLSRHRDWGMRVYRTRSGFRYLVTHAPFDPGDSDTEAAMQFLGCDPNYMMLCRAQKSFRARLTPKPWRCSVRKPPGRFPWQNKSEEQAMRAWEAEYANVAKRFATCAFVEAIGNPQVDRSVAPVIELHDEQTRATSGLPLA
jgi:hypothetical protein